MKLPRPEGDTSVDRFEWKIATIVITSVGVGEVISILLLRGSTARVFWDYVVFFPLFAFVISWSCLSLFDAQNRRVLMLILAELTIISLVNYYLYSIVSALP
jgi:hypothetical protein